MYLCLLNHPRVVGFLLDSRCRYGTVSSHPLVSHETKHETKSTRLFLSKKSEDQQNLNDDNLHRTMKKAGMTFFFALGLTMSTTLYSIHDAQAAPPVAVIAEELGYFPVRNQEDEIVYVPARVKRESSEQDILLARALQKSGATMFGTYWCPHTSRQKELFGRQAWEMIPYVECAPQGWKAKPAVCLAQKVDGYPTWVFTKTGQRLSGERPLEQIAEQVHFSGYSAELETDLPVPIGSACKLKK